MSEFLRHESHEVAVAAVYAEALSVLEGGANDAALVDIILPRRSGIM
jgi:CheY-like chemotaxis protein